MEKDIELSLKNQEEKERVDRVLEILLEADLIYLGKLLEEENNLANLHKKIDKECKKA
ncbi:MAG: hypothetical protein Q8O13_06560 [Candidatus Omnitrophota bacterium]|nr:hypothetical protein [Candidatus Omnitrophota bacterium]